MMLIFGQRLTRLRALEKAAQRMVEASDRFACGPVVISADKKEFLWGLLVGATNDLDEALIMWGAR